MAKKLFGIAIDERIYVAIKKTSKDVERSRNWLIERALAEKFGIVVNQPDAPEEKKFEVNVED